MQITMTKEEFDKAIADAEIRGQLKSLEDLNYDMSKSYDSMTKGFFSRLGREANIEMSRRFINVIRERIRKLK